MNRRLVFAVFAAVLLATSASAASRDDVNAAIDRNLGNHTLYEEMITTFQHSVATGDKADVAAFVRYPIVVKSKGHKRTIRSSSAFIRAYDSIMTSDIVAAVTTQKYEDLFVNSDGVMFGDGQVWVRGICLDRRCRHFVPKVVTIQHTSE